MDLPRSGALIVSLYRDSAGGAPWYARVESFADAADGTVQNDVVTGESELLAAVRSWFSRVTGPTGQHS